MHNGSRNHAVEAPSRVLIAGGGVAALEAAVALRSLARDRVAMTMLAPERELVYQPLSVGDPFAHGPAKRYPLQRAADDLGIELRRDALAAVDPERNAVTTASDDRIPYDALLVAIGASRVPAYEHALTFRGQEDTGPMHGLVQDLEAGYLRRVAFVVPPGTAWALPLYELALMTAARMREMSIEAPEITVVTPEDRPLAIFGVKASQDVDELLRRAGIRVVPVVHAEVERPGEVQLRPGGGVLHCDRVVALPRIAGCGIDGLPADDAGFIPIDSYGRVAGLDDVYAAGDGTAFPVKQGGIACQQADVAARAIAHRAGADVDVEPFRPVLRGQLMTGREPAFLRHDLRGGHAEERGLSSHRLWWPPSKIAGAYLTMYLNALPETEPAHETADVPLDVQAVGSIVSRVAI